MQTAASWWKREGRGLLEVTHSSTAWSLRGDASFGSNLILDRKIARAWTPPVPDLVPLRLKAAEDVLRTSALRLRQTAVKSQIVAHPTEFEPVISALGNAASR
jgi:hypothetical protein